MPLEPEYNFGEKIRNFLNEYGEQTRSLSVALPISTFKGMDPTRISEYLTNVRKKTPLVHIYFDETVSRTDMPFLVVQADFIIIWEQDPEKFYQEKRDIVNFWKGRVRNFNGRTIRMMEDGVRTSYLPQDETIKNFYQKDNIKLGT